MTDIEDDVQRASADNRELMPELPLYTYLGIVRRNLWLVLLCVVIGAAVAAGVSLSATSMYQADAMLVVQQGGSVLQPGTSSPEPLTQTMSGLLQSPIVAHAVIDALHLQMTPQALLSHLGVTTRPQSTVLDVTFSSPKPSTNIEVLAQIDRTFPALVRKELGATAQSRADSAVVTVTAFGTPVLEPGRVSPRPARIIAIAAGLGLVVGLALAILADTLARHRLVRARDTEAMPPRTS